MPGYVILLIVLALFVLPIPVGGYLARRLRMPEYGWRISLILWSLACALVVVCFGHVKFGIDLSGGVILVYEVEPDEEEASARTLSTEQMEKLIAAVKRRVDPGGVKEVTIRQYGAEQIEIIIPEVDADEAALIKRTISSEGTLEFRILANPQDDQHKRLIDRAESDRTSRYVKDNEGNTLAWWVPVAQGKENNFQSYIAQKEAVLRRPQKEEEGEQDLWEILVIKDQFDVTGKYLRRAYHDIDAQSGDPCVSFVLNSSGGTLFRGLTGKYRPKEAQDLNYKLGIVLNGFLQSAPVIRSTISEHGQITGLDDDAEVRELVAVLNAGSLPTALSKEPISELVTGPTLGQDTINRGKWAIGVSMIVVLLFMLFYYRFAGMVACMALVANLVLIVAIMITIKAAFTLPGLAGLVLTVGMAVDANVLIFERIREELTRGAALRMAIRNGFGRATTTVVDANLTTLITAVILYMIGTDQIKGFAVTLFLGVVLSMYTAIFCSRVIFDVAERRRWLTELKMLRMLGATNIDFLSWRRPMAAVSALIIVCGLTGVVVRGQGLLDIDFTGGVAVEAVFDESHPQKVADVRKALEDELPDLAVSDVQIEGEKPGLRFRVNTSQPEIDREQKKQRVRDALARQLNAAFGPGTAGQRKSIVEGFVRQFDELLDKETDSPEWVAARAELDQRIDEIFAKAPDQERALAAARDVKENLDQALMTATELVERKLQRVFGQKLAHNEMTYELAEIPEASTGPETPAPAASSKTPAASAVGSPAQPESEQGARRDLPSGSLLAMAEPGRLWLAQADPSRAEPDAKPEGEVGEAHAEAGDAPEPAGPGEKTQAAEAPTPDPAEAEPREPAQETQPRAEPARGAPESSPPAGPAAEPSKTPDAEAGPTPAAEAAGQPREQRGPSEEPGPGPDEVAGWTKAELDFSHRVDHDTLRDLLIGYFGSEASLPPLDISNPEYKPGENAAYTEWTVRILLPPQKAKPAFEAIQSKLAEKPFFPSSTTIGGKVAANTRNKAITALIASLLCIVGYIWIRFQRVVFGLAAVAALVHDVLVTLGVIALSYWIAQLPGVKQALLIDQFKIGLPALAAFLTIIGYSLNDTIVVFDRIREVKGKTPQLTDAMVNTSINQTLARTLLTSLTTLMVVGILYFGGGQGIHGFAFALVIGVVVGTYSSIFVASPSLLWMSRPAKSR